MRSRRTAYQKAQELMEYEMAKAQLEDRDAVRELLFGPAKKPAKSEQPSLDAAEAALHAGNIDDAITIASGLVDSLCAAESSLPKRNAPRGLPASVPDTDAPMPIGEIQLRWAMQIARERWLPFLDLFPFEYTPVVYAAITAELDGTGIARLEQLCDYDELGRLRRRAELWQHGWTAYTTADTEADKLAAAGQVWQFIVTQREPALYLQVIDDEKALPFLLANLNYAAIASFFQQHSATLKSHNSPLDAYKITTDMASTHSFLQDHYNPAGDIDEHSEIGVSNLIRQLEYESNPVYRQWITATALPAVYYSVLETLATAEGDDKQTTDALVRKLQHKRTLYLLSDMADLTATHLRPLVATLNAITLDPKHVNSTLPALIIKCAELLSTLVTTLPPTIRDELAHQDDAPTKANCWFHLIAYSLLSLAKPDSTAHLLATELDMLLDNPGNATKQLDAITVAGIIAKLQEHTPRATARKTSSAGSNPTALIKQQLMLWTTEQTGATFDPTATATTTTDLRALQTRYRLGSISLAGSPTGRTASCPVLALDRLATLSSQYGSHGSAASLGGLAALTTTGPGEDDTATESTTSSDDKHKPLTLEELICFTVAMAAGAANLTDSRLPTGFHLVYQALADSKGVNAHVLMQLALQYQAALDNIQKSDQHQDKKREVLRAQLYSKLRMLALIPTGEDGALLISILTKRERMTRSVRKSLSRSGPIDWSYHHSEHAAMQALHGILDAADGGSYAGFCAAMASGYKTTDTPTRTSERSLHADFIRMVVIVYLEQLLYPTFKKGKDPRKDMDYDQTTTLGTLDDTLNRFREDQRATVFKIITAVRGALIPLEARGENRCHRKIVAPTLAFCRAVLASPLTALDSELIIGEGRLSSVFHSRHGLTPPEPTMGSPDSTRGASTGSPATPRPERY